MRKEEVKSEEDVLRNGRGCLCEKRQNVGLPLVNSNSALVGIGLWRIEVAQSIEEICDGGGKVHKAEIWS